MPTWLVTSRHAPTADILRTRQSIPAARLKTMLPAFSVRPRCILRLSSIAAASVTGGIRIPSAASPWAYRRTETAEHRLVLPLYRIMKRILKRRVKFLGTANQASLTDKVFDPAQFSH